MNAAAAAAAQKHTSSPLLQETVDGNKKLKKSIRMKQADHTGPTLDKSAQIIPKPDISLFRNSLKQNICVEMLREGYHRSFSELLSLLHSDQGRRAMAEPGSASLTQIPLEEQRDKLERIQLHLKKAEEAGRSGSWSVVCEQRLSLGHFFSVPEDLWLGLHFYHSCADKGRGGGGGGGGMGAATEARACMAEVYLQQGALEEARQQAELCVQQAEDVSWLDSSGRPLRLRACQTLWRIYSQLADTLLVTEDFREALTLLQKGLHMAKEAEDKQIEGEAAYQLGLAYQRADDHNTAKQLFTICMQIRGTLQDAEGLATVCMTMAKSSESEGNVDESVQYLEKAADISQSNDLQHQLAVACIHLGTIYYNRNQYERACEYFQQGFDVACKMEDLALTHQTQVFLASARGHTLIRKYMADMESATSLQQLQARTGVLGPDPAHSTDSLPCSTAVDRA
ncbi:tetratricopeptide repeat protein 29 [Genypterus blacodes]|uniref:tetratricopeptide repeat protein 29 n=1 Tax=Genypterus blacodes TaxID=154954 RepID=UPI003F772219